MADSQTPELEPSPPDFDDVLAAQRRITPYARVTPVLQCTTLDRLAESSLFFKCENFQKVGAFKFRGACNAVFSITDEEAAAGVVTHSSGNHAAALALASRLRGVRARIVMPRTAPTVKREAVAGYGGEITFCEPTQQAREATTQAIIDQTGAVLIHPYNDARIIAGQATAALELLEEVGSLDAVVAPVGGGGLLSGTSLAVRARAPGCRVLGAEPANADDAFRSWTEQRLAPLETADTIADGLRTSLGPLTFAVIRSGVDGVVRVSEEEIVDAMRLVWERMKIVIEPSSAVAVAAVLSPAFPARGGRIGVILSGGNVDLENLPFGRQRA